MPHLAAALLILLLVPASAAAQAGTSYQVPPDNPFVGQAGADEIYALGLRNPFRFSFDRLNGEVWIGDVGGGLREEIDWVTRSSARRANFGWACREGTQTGPRSLDCPVPGAIGPFYEYLTTDPGSDAVTGGFVVRDPSLQGLVGRYVFADFFEGVVRSLARPPAAPDPQDTGVTLLNLASFGEDSSARLYAASLNGQVVRLVYGGSPGTLASQPLTGPFAAPVALATFPGDATRLFVGERAGKVRLVVNDAVRTTPVLDIGPLSMVGERGLLSVVAAPDYASTGRLYVHYTDAEGDIRIDEFTRSSADPEVADPLSRRNLLEIPHSLESNHNGGQMHFGPDGCLWFTTGDGGGQNNEHDNSQNTGTLLGKLLRIDPDPPGVGGGVCRSDATVSPPPPGPGSGGTADTRAPGITAFVARRQRVLRRRGVVARVRCDEHCSISAGGTLAIRRRRLLLRRVPAAAVANDTVRLLVRLRPRAVRRLRRALANGRRPRVTVRMEAYDAAGNLSPRIVRFVRVRR